VNDAGIDTVQDPLVGDSFVSKEERLITYLSGNGNNINLTAGKYLFCLLGLFRNGLYTRKISCILKDSFSQE
jgi:hypothetical protein